MKRVIVAQQGEVRVYRIDDLPAGMKTREPQRDAAGRAIISHSESGHNHVIAGGAEVLEREDNVPAGMAIFYAICCEPDALIQDAPTPHGRIPLEADSIYECRVSREYDPFMEIARRVMD